MKFAASIACIFVLLAATAHAWGPASHYYFTSAGLSSFTKETMSGTEMPDAFFFGDFVTGSNCTGVGALHNLEYGGYLVKQAIGEGNNTALLNIGLGFGAHVVGDYAGFFPGGFLGPHDVAPFSNWISIWPFMTSVDAYVAQNIRSPVNESSYVPQLTKTTSEFMKRARDAMAKDVPVTPNITADEIHYCANRWQYVVERETKKSMALPKASYEFDMIYNSQYGATTAAETVMHFVLAAECAIEAISAWEQKILNPKVTPHEAMMDIQMMYISMFKQGRCAPSAPAPPQQVHQKNFF